LEKRAQKKSSSTHGMSRPPCRNLTVKRGLRWEWERGRGGAGQSQKRLNPLLGGRVRGQKKDSGKREEVLSRWGQRGAMGISGGGAPNTTIGRGTEKGKSKSAKRVSYSGQFLTLKEMSD